MATLGRLVLMLEAKGTEQVLSALRSVQQIAGQVDTSLKSSTNSYKENQQAIYGTTQAQKGLQGSFVDLIQSYAIYSKMQKQAVDLQKNTATNKEKTSLLQDFSKQAKILSSLAMQKLAYRELQNRGAGKPGDVKKIYDLDQEMNKQDGLLSKLSSKWGQLSTAIAPATWTIGNAVGMMGKLISFTAEYYGAIFKFVVPALTVIGTKAVQAAAEIENMNLRMQAVKIGQFKQEGFSNKDAIDKSIASSKEMLDIVKQIAIPSTYLTKDLFDASIEMEAFGINAKKALQPAAMLAEVFGGTNEDLAMVVRQMGRMAAGLMPDARALAKFGMNRAQIEKEMGKLPAGTESPMLSAFIKIITENYGELFNRLQNSFNSKLASLQEQGQFALGKIGAPLLDALTPAIEKFTQFIEQLDASGTLKMFGNALAEVVNRLTEPEFLDMLENTFFDLIGLLHSWAYELSKTIKFFVSLYQFLKETFKMGGPGLPGFIGSLIAKKDLGGFSPDLWVKGLKGTFANMPNVPGLDIMNGMQFAGGYRANLQKWRDKNIPTGTSPFDPDKYKNEKLISNIEKTRVATEEQNDKLDKIKDNTKKASDELSLRQAALGGRGGPLNQLGMSPTQIAFAGNVNMNKSAFVDPSLMNPVSMLEKAIVEIVRRNDSKTFRRF